MGNSRGCPTNIPLRRDVHPYRVEVTPPTFNDYLTAYGTVSASVIALAFGVVAEARTRADRKARVIESAMQREARRQEQAEHVAIWGTEEPRVGGREDETVFSLVVHNASDLPITEVSVPLKDDQGASVSWLINALVPGETRKMEVSLDLLRLNEDLGSPSRTTRASCGAAEL